MIGADQMLSSSTWCLFKDALLQT